MDKIAYLTVITNIKYIQGFYALYESLLAHVSPYNQKIRFAVLIPEGRKELDDSLQSIKKITKWDFDIVKRPFNFIETKKLKLERDYWRETYFKLHMFGLVEFKKIVYLDSDIFVNSNIDELFCCEHMSAVASNVPMHPSRNYFTSAVLVIVPNVDIERRLIELYQKHLSTYDNKPLIGDEQIIRELYSEWWIQHENLHLPIDYCVNFLWTNYMIKKNKYNMKCTKILHFSGPTKPWCYTLKNKVAIYLRCLIKGNFQGVVMLRKYLYFLKKYKRVAKKIG